MTGEGRKGGPVDARIRVAVMLCLVVPVARAAELPDFLTLRDKRTALVRDIDDAKAQLSKLDEQRKDLPGIRQIEAIIAEYEGELLQRRNEMTAAKNAKPPNVGEVEHRQAVVSKMEGELGRAKVQQDTVASLNRQYDDVTKGLRSSQDAL